MRTRLRKITLNAIISIEVEVNLEELMQLNHFLWLSRVLISCVELDVFSAIGEKGADLKGVAEKTNSSLRGMGGLLNVLIPLGLLTRDDGGKYHLTENGKRFMLPGSPEYMVPRIKHMRRLWESWSGLTDSIRAGESYWKTHAPSGGVSNLVDLAEGLFPRNFAVSSEAAEKLGAGDSWKGLQILDVGAGSGAWSLAFLKRDPTARAVALDFGPVLEMAKSKAKQLGVEGRFEVLAGNLRETEFGENRFDLVILGHICHSEGPELSGKLIAKSARSMKRGGKLLIADMIPDEDRRGPLHPLLFALNMLINSEQGGTFTFGEYRKWCEDAGLVNAHLLPLSIKDHSPLVIAEKM